MNYSLGQTFKECFLILLLILFYTISIWLSVNNYNVTFIAMPITILVGLWVWKTQELKKRRADAAEAMFKAYHAYAIKMYRFDYIQLPKLKQGSALDKEEIKFLEETVDELIDLRAEYLVCRQSFYRVTDVSKEKQIELDTKFETFDRNIAGIEKVLSRKNPTLEDLEIIERKNKFSYGYAEKAGEALDKMIKPFIKLE